MARVDVDPSVQVLRLVARWSSTAFAEGSSGWHFLLSAAVDDPEDVIANFWLSLLAPAYIAGRHSSWRLDELVVTRRYPPGPADRHYDVRLEADPEGEGNGLPPQVSPLISWRTGVPGRANRGRTYMGPYCVDSADLSNVVGPAGDATSDFAEAMIANFTGLLTPLFGIYSRQLDGELLETPAFVPVTTYYNFGKWAVVRRRLAWEWRT